MKREDSTPQQTSGSFFSSRPATEQDLPQQQSGYQRGHTPALSHFVGPSVNQEFLPTGLAGEPSSRYPIGQNYLINSPASHISLSFRGRGRVEPTRSSSFPECAVLTGSGPMHHHQHPQHRPWHNAPASAPPHFGPPPLYHQERGAGALQYGAHGGPLTPLTSSSFLASGVPKEAESSSSHYNSRASMNAGMFATTYHSHPPPQESPRAGTFQQRFENYGMHPHSPQAHHRFYGHPQYLDPPSHKIHYMPQHSYPNSGYDKPYDRRYSTHATAPATKYESMEPSAGRNVTMDAVAAGAAVPARMGTADVSPRLQGPAQYAPTSSGSEQVQPHPNYYPADINNRGAGVPQGPVASHGPQRGSPCRASMSPLNQGESSHPRNSRMWQSSDNRSGGNYRMSIEGIVNTGLKVALDETKTGSLEAWDNPSENGLGNINAQELVEQPSPKRRKSNQQSSGNYNITSQSAGPSPKLSSYPVGNMPHPSSSLESKAAVGKLNPHAGSAQRLGTPASRASETLTSFHLDTGPERPVFGRKRKESASAARNLTIQTPQYESSDPRSVNAKTTAERGEHGASSVTQQDDIAAREPVKSASHWPSQQKVPGHQSYQELGSAQHSSSNVGQGSGPSRLPQMASTQHLQTPAVQQTQPSTYQQMGPSGPLTATHAVSMHPSRASFLSLFENFYDTLQDARVLKHALEDQIRKSTSLLQTLQASSDTMEAMVERSLKEQHFRFGNDIQRVERKWSKRLKIVENKLLEVTGAVALSADSPQQSDLDPVQQGEEDEEQGLEGQGQGQAEGEEGGERDDQGDLDEPTVEESRIIAQEDPAAASSLPPPSPNENHSEPAKATVILSEAMMTTERDFEPSADVRTSPPKIDKSVSRDSTVKLLTSPKEPETVNSAGLRTAEHDLTVI